MTPADPGWWLGKAQPPRLYQPVAEWVGYLVEGAGDLACPRCFRRGAAPAVLSHVFRDHGLSFSEVAAWLETVDGDLFSLAVHYLVSKDRSNGRTN